LKSETQFRLCDPELLEAREFHFSRLDDLYAGKKLEYAFVLNGILGHSPADPYKEPEKWLDECLDSLVEMSERAMDRVVFRPLVVEYGIYGVHFIDRILGAHVYWGGDQWWVDYLESPIGELECPDLESDETWKLARDTAKAFAAREVTVPLFGLPTLASVLNIAVISTAKILWWR